MPFPVGKERNTGAGIKQAVFTSAQLSGWLMIAKLLDGIVVVAIIQNRAVIAGEYA